MSWFVDVAGKAEELLNRVDKTAAVALQQTELRQKEKYDRLELQSQPTHYDYVDDQNTYSKKSLR